MTASRDEPSYAVGAVVRITGLSPHVLRAWERRYGAVRPARTAGGTRRYSEAQVTRLRLLQAAILAGHAIGQLAQLPDEEIERRLAALRPPPAAPLDEIVAAVQRLDARELERLVTMQLALVGPRVFARAVAGPLLREVGARWERGELSVASEHMLSAMARSVLGAALRAPGPSTELRPILFSTPSGERHELGALIAAVCAAGAGANAVYLGPDLPASELVGVVRRLGAAVVALSLVSLEDDAALAYLGELRTALPRDVPIWTGGGRRGAFERIPGVERIDDLDELERRVSSAKWRRPLADR